MDWLLLERTRELWKTQLPTQAALMPYTKNGGERLEELQLRYWDQVYPWDYYQRLYEAGLSQMQLDKIMKGQVMGQTEGLRKLYEQMKEAGEL